MIRVSLAVLIAGCGRFGFEARVDVPDAALDGNAASCEDAWLAGAPRLSAPVALTVLNLAGTDERDPSLSPDGLTLYYSRDNDVYRATRADRGSPFGAAVRDELSTTAIESKVAFSDTGLEVFVARQGVAVMDIFRAERTSTAVPFGPLSRVAALSNSPTGTYDPELSSDGLRIYLAPVTGGGLIQDIVMQERDTPQSAWSGGRPLVEINTSNEAEADPALSPDERVMLYTHATAANVSEIRFVVRASRADVFGASAIVPGLDEPGLDADATLTDDACEVFFASRRSGDFDLYTARVIP